MSGCQIQAILNELGPNANSNEDLRGWCDNQYSNNKNFSLPAGAHCEVSSRNFSPKYPLGTLFTCGNNSLSVTLGKDAPSVDAPAYVTVAPPKTTTPTQSFKTTPGENCTPIKPISGATSYIYDANGNCIATPTGGVCTTGNDSNGTSFVYGADGGCVPTKCNDGYTLANNKCNVTPPPPPPQKEETPLKNKVDEPEPSGGNTMLIVIVLILLLLGGGAAFFFMKKPKAPSSMTAFGKKLAKIAKGR